MRRSFQLSGSYDIIKDAADLESKCLVFAVQVFIDLLYLKRSVIAGVLHFCFYLLSETCRVREVLIMIVFPWN